MNRNPRRHCCTQPMIDDYRLGSAPATPSLAPLFELELDGPLGEIVSALKARKVGDVSDAVRALSEVSAVANGALAAEQVKCFQEGLRGKKPKANVRVEAAGLQVIGLAIGGWADTIAELHSSRRRRASLFAAIPYAIPTRQTVVLRKLIAPGAGTSQHLLHMNLQAAVHMAATLGLNTLLGDLVRQSEEPQKYLALAMATDLMCRRANGPGQRRLRWDLLAAALPVAVPQAWVILAGEKEMILVDGFRFASLLDEMAADPDEIRQRSGAWASIAEPGREAAEQILAAYLERAALAANVDTKNVTPLSLP